MSTNVMHKFSINNLPSEIKLSGGGTYDENTCSIELSDHTIEALKAKKIEIEFYKLPNSQKIINNLKVRIQSTRGRIIVRIGSSDNEVVFEKGSLGNYDLLLWSNSKILIGPKTTANNMRLFSDNSKFVCGEDCMFSDGVLIQCTDQHGVIDLKSGSIVNNNYKEVILGNHVWLGRNATLTANATIGNGSIIGTGSIVVNEIPSKVVAAGVPAYVIKRNHTWSRSQGSIDIYAGQYIEEYKLIDERKDDKILYKIWNTVSDFIKTWVMRRTR